MGFETHTLFAFREILQILKIVMLLLLGVLTLNLINLALFYFINWGSTECLVLRFRFFVDSQRNWAVFLGVAHRITTHLRLLRPSIVY